MGELFYKLANYKYLYEQRKHLPFIDKETHLPLWTMIDGRRIQIPNMDSKHLRNTIKMLEREHPEINSEFQSFLEDKDIGFHVIYMLTFMGKSKKGSKNHALKYFFHQNYFYFLMRREEIHRMKNFEREMWNNVRSKQSQRNYEPGVNGNP